MFKFSENRHKTRSETALDIPLGKTNTEQQSLSFLGRNIWTKISQNIKNVNTTASFTHINSVESKNLNKVYRQIIGKYAFEYTSRGNLIYIYYIYILDIIYIYMYIYNIYIYIYIYIHTHTHTHIYLYTDIIILYIYYMQSWNIKTMCPPSHHYNGFVASHAWHLMHLDTWCTVLWDWSTLCVVDQLWQLTYNIYNIYEIYIVCMFVYISVCHLYACMY